MQWYHWLVLYFAVFVAGWNLYTVTHPPGKTSAMVVCTLPGDNALSYVHAKAARVNGAETDIWFEDGTYEELTSPCEVIFDTKR